MKYVYKANLPMFVQFANKVMGVDGSFREPEAVALEGIEGLEEFFVKMGLPTTMQELGIDGSRVEAMAKQAIANKGGESIGGLKQLQWEDVVAIYKLAQ